MNHIINRLRCYGKSPTAQNVFQPIPGTSLAALGSDTIDHLTHNARTMNYVVAAVIPLQSFVVDLPPVVLLAFH